MSNDQICTSIYLSIMAGEKFEIHLSQIPKLNIQTRFRIGIYFVPGFSQVNLQNTWEKKVFQGFPGFSRVFQGFPGFSRVFQGSGHPDLKNTLIPDYKIVKKTIYSFIQVKSIVNNKFILLKNKKLKHKIKKILEHCYIIHLLSLPCLLHVPFLVSICQI